jgi:G protein-coupled receptor GPR1
MQKTREKIRRQLRLLFIYPLVYLVIWVVPFISHVVKWDDPDDPGPFGMLVVSLASLCIQGAVNSWLFSTREKPWRYRRRIGRGGSGLRWGVGGQGSVGRTREEMLVEGRAARRRRDAEIEERRGREGVENRRKSNRHWWDVLDVDVDMDSSDEESLI